MEPHIRSTKPGQTVLDFFIVRKRAEKFFDGMPFLILELGCARGRIRAVYKGAADFADLAKVVVEDAVVKVQGVVSEFRGSVELRISKIRLARDGEVSLDKLMPPGRIPVDVLAERLQSSISSVKHPHLAELLRYIFLDDNDFFQKFITFPAAKLWHGAYVGGLADHTLRVASISTNAAPFYPNCRKELLLCGALLHDIGKIRELSANGRFDYTLSGRLHGHVYLGAELISQQAARIRKFDPKIYAEILHLVLAHHGKLEHGAPVVPKTIEAMLLHQADMLDAHVEAVQHIVETELSSGDVFSSFDKMLDRYLYLDGYREVSADDGKDLTERPDFP